MKKIFLTIVLVLVQFLFAAGVIGGIFSLGYFWTDIAYADEYSILDDFAGTDFDISQYPADSNDNSLQLKQIAETIDGKLVIYVYQPSTGVKELRATAIRISTAINDNAKWYDYSLEYIGSESTIHKYKVKDLSVKSDALRYYDIPCLFRSWDDIDNETGNDNTIDLVDCPVNQLWTVSTVGDSVTYSMIQGNSITVKDKYFDCLLYISADGKTYSLDAYVAFNTDIEMNELLEADVQSTVISRDLTGYESVLFDGTNTVRYDEYFVTPDHVNHTWLNIVWWQSSSSHTWSKIQSVDDFIASSDGTLKGVALDNVKNKTWVIHFYTDKWTLDTFQKPIYKEYQVSKASVLRLSYVTDGVPYNVGVIDNYQSSDWELGNKPIEKKSMPWWMIIIAVVVVIIIIFILMKLKPGATSIVTTICVGFLKGVLWALNGLIKGLVILFKGLLWLLTSPFRLIKYIIDKRQGGAT